MRIARLSVVVGALLIATLAAGPLAAQSGAGEIEGTVVDADGAVLPGVAVAATNDATGISRSATSGGDGSYQLFAVPIGSYTVTYTLDGFSEVIQQNVTVNVARTTTIDVTMQLATVEETITVTSAPPLINQSPAVGTVVTQNEIDNLPMNGRQFANLGVLAPGTTLAYNSDPTKPGQLTVNLNGGNGRNVNYVIDGGDNTDDTIGGALQNFNLEAVEEFNIQTMQYKAEFGRSSGGVLSVVTKTGSNELNGSVWGYFRDDSLNSKTETERLAGVPKGTYEREQYGFAIGGPFVKDRAHWFGTYEKTERTTDYTVFTDGFFPTFDGTVVGLPFEDELVTAKGTIDLNAENYLQVRYGYQKNDDKYGASPLTAPDGLGTLSNEYESVLGGWTSQLSSTMLNEFLYQYTSFDNTISADSSAPLIYYPSGFHTGQNLNTPQSTHQRKRQYRDDFTWTMDLGGRRHDWKAGVNYIDEPSLGGDFTTGTAGQYTALNDELGSPIIDIQVTDGFLGDETPVEQLNVYLQDDFYVNDRLTLNLGLRYDQWTGFDLDQRANPMYQILHDQRTYTEDYLVDFFDFDGVLDEDDDNFAPRLGFTYDLKGDGRHLVRGGYGTYFDFPYTNATILFPAFAVQSLYGLVYLNHDDNGIRNPDGSFFQPGQPLPPNQLPNPELGDGGPEIASPTLATPYSDQTSLGYSWQVNDWLGLNFEVVSIDYHDLPYRFRFNVIDPATGQRRFGDDLSSFPRMWMGNGRATYEGFNVGGRIRQQDFELQGFYTYSEAEGNTLAGADEFRITGAEYQADVGGTRNRRDVSCNPLNPLDSRCFGPLYTDAEHRITLGGLYRGPWDLVFSGMLRYRSALPYNEHGNCDLNGDGDILDLGDGVTPCPQTFDEDGNPLPLVIPPAVPHVNSGRGFDFTQLDLRVSKEFDIGEDFGVEVIVDAFNVFNDENPARPDRFGVASAFAGDPGQGEQQLFQLGVRFRF